MFLEVNKDDQKTVLEIDARPSDCLALALMNKAPIFCTEETMKKAIAVEEPQ
jgi:bifunctional DNase/RNase